MFREEDGVPNSIRADGQSRLREPRFHERDDECHASVDERECGFGRERELERRPSGPFGPIAFGSIGQPIDRCVRIRRGLRQRVLPIPREHLGDGRRRSAVFQRQEAREGRKNGSPVASRRGRLFETRGELRVELVVRVPCEPGRAGDVAEAVGRVGAASREPLHGVLFHQRAQFLITIEAPGGLHV